MEKKIRQAIEQLHAMREAKDELRKDIILRNDPEREGSMALDIESLDFALEVLGTLRKVREMEWENETENHV